MGIFVFLAVGVFMIAGCVMLWAEGEPVRGVAIGAIGFASFVFFAVVYSYYSDKVETAGEYGNRKELSAVSVKEGGLNVYEESSEYSFSAPLFRIHVSDGDEYTAERRLDTVFGPFFGQREIWLTEDTLERLGIVVYETAG